MLRGFLVYLIGCFLCVFWVQGQMVPIDPVLDFRLPRFSDNGYAQWILRGGEGIYDNDAQIRVKEMSLRIYSGDERKVLEMTMDSPEATFLIKENRAVSDSPIEIVGSNFKVSGVGWAWNGTKKEIEVKSDCVVEFSQEVAGMLSGRAPETESDSSLTKIFSNRLLLETTPEAYRFQFIDSVRVVSKDTELTSESLVAIADVPEGKDPDDASMTELKIDSINQIIASGQVVISQAGNVLKAEEAVFSLREQSADFSGNPSIRTPGALVSGDSIHSERGTLIVRGGDTFGRAKLVVSQSTDLAIAKGMASGQETVAFADTIRMQEFETENQFEFEGSAEVLSGATRLQTDDLTLYFDPALDDKNDPVAAGASEEDAGLGFRLGEVVRVTGEGAIRVEQEDKIATCEKAVFYPREELVMLYGNPRLESEQAIITGATMELKRGQAIVNSSPEELINVILPKLPDLGADSLDLTDGMSPPDADEVAVDQSELTESKTIVKAKTLLMTEHPDHYAINFTDFVSVEGTNLKARCSQMDVILVEQPDDSRAEGGEQMQVQSIHAYENIVFEQIESGRTAKADKATIKPVEGEVVLEGNAVLTDEQGEVTGHRITLHKGKRRATVEGNKTEGSRARIVLPEMELPDNFPGGK